MKMSYFHTSVKAEVVGCTELLNLDSLLGCQYWDVHFGHFDSCSWGEEWDDVGYMVFQHLYAAISVICCLVPGSLLPSRSKCLAGGFFSSIRRVCKCEAVHIVFTAVWQNLCSGLYLAGRVSASLRIFKSVVRDGAALALNQGLQLWMFPSSVTTAQNFTAL